MRRKSSHRFSTLLGAVLLAAGAVVPAHAQDPDDLKRSVARISLMDGEVSVRRGDSGEWVAGVINAPLLTDDRIASGANSRAEVQLDSANILRIGANSEIHLAELEYGRYQLEVARGTVTFRVLRPSTASVELNTPSVSVRPAKEGTYRASVNDAGETEVTARAGDVEVFTPKGSQWVYAGQTMMARGTMQDPEFQMIGAIPSDDWDRWNEARDRTLLQSSTSYQYVPQGVYGAEDLDSSGTWAYVAPYGYCWRPTVVVADWAPYRNGRWVYEDWYGWTWVSYDTWGWAPYHYGRWFFDARFGWNWYPGLMGVRHYWSPALVGFFGYGGVGVGFGFGHVGWVPLAPYETFRPWWGRGNAGVGLNRNVNITNINVSSIYRNARIGNGISGVRSEDFGAGRFHTIQRVNAGQVQQAGMVNGRMPITPSAASRHFSDRTVANTPRVSGNTQFYSRQGSAGGQGIGAQVSRPSGNSQPQSGYRRFGDPGGNAASQNNRSQQPVNNGNPASQRQGSLQRFGEPGSSQSVQHTDRQPATQGGTNSWRSFGTPGSSNPAPRQPYNPPPNRPAPSSPSQNGGGRSYSPPPSYSAPRQAPSTNAPQRSAPAPQRSAPPSGGGNRAPATSGGKGARR